MQNETTTEVVTEKNTGQLDTEGLVTEIDLVQARHKNEVAHTRLTNAQAHTIELENILLEKQVNPEAKADMPQ